MRSYRLSQDQLNFIPRIYDTVTNPDAWADVLDEFAQFCGAKGGGLMMIDLVNPDVSIMRTSTYFSDLDQAWYHETFGPEEVEAYSVVAKHPAHTWITDETAFGRPAETIPGTKFQMENAGVFRRVGTRLNATPIWMDGLNLNYQLGRDNMTPEEDATSQLFMPHLAKAVEVSRPFLLLQQRFQAVLNVLDRLRIGIAIIGRRGEIAVANQAAGDAFHAGNGIYKSADDKMAVHDSALQRQLDQRIASAAEAGHPEDYSPVLAVPKKDGELSWLLEVFPLSNLDDGLGPAFQGAAVFITDPARTDIISTEGIAALFGLTEAENDVCGLLTNGLRVSEVAEERNTSVDTTRSQVKTLFSKTGASSQSDLVRLALKVNLPVDPAQ